jgi:hypothetical protein
MMFIRAGRHVLACAQIVRIQETGTRKNPRVKVVCTRGSDVTLVGSAASELLSRLDQLASGQPMVFRTEDG